MKGCLIMNMELWSGFFGTIIGAGIGGYIAYLIAKFQFDIQDKKLQEQAIKDKDTKEIQLLWQIYFDIKKDPENSKLWDKYYEILQMKESRLASSTAEYINETLTYIMRDLRNFFKLLNGKESEVKTDQLTELGLLWERAGQYLVFLLTIYQELKKYNDVTDSNLLTYY